MSKEEELNEANTVIESLKRDLEFEKSEVKRLKKTVMFWFDEVNKTNSDKAAEMTDNDLINVKLHKNQEDE